MGVRICYVDESGDTRPLGRDISTIAPVCVIAGVVIEQAALSRLTQEFIELKRHWFPSLMPRNGRYLDSMLVEIKGADLRKAMRDGAKRRNRRHALGFLSKFVKLLEDYDVRVIGRVWVKEPGRAINEKALYGSSIQAICAYFENFLGACNEQGIVVADSRTPALNAAVAHSIFTQKFKVAGDKYGRILEMPTFGHSENHAGIQIADLLASALLFPMASAAYCQGYVEGVHVQQDFVLLQQRFGSRLCSLQHRYKENGRPRGGLTVDDRIAQRHGGMLFRPLE